MSSKPTLLYPYHPHSGKRLTGTLEYRAIHTQRDITKADGVLFLGHEVTSEHEANTEIARLDSRVVLVTADGHLCFDTDAIWSEVDAASVDIQDADQPQQCRYRSPNEANASLDSLAEQARCVVMEWEGSNLAGAVCCLAGELDSLGYASSTDGAEC